MPGHSYASAERFLLSREFFGMKLGLENITSFLESIGTPQQHYHTIHLAGTNGKGSCAAMLDSILRSHGYKTGLFTSPHLVNFRERVRVNGRMIPKPSLVRFVDQHRKELTRRKLSFFETVTAMALQYFARTAVDVAVIETGLGGRLDATNVLSPLLTMTTDISRDHVEILGSTLPKIAVEKAGIIKPGVPHLVAALPRPAERVIARRCDQLSAPLHRLTAPDYLAHNRDMTLDFNCNGYTVSGLKCSLFGEHQLKNAALVLKALTILKERGLKVSTGDLKNGLGRVKWPGRFQIVLCKGRPTLVLDVCHNEGGVRAFVDAFKARFPNRRAAVLTGLVKRKEHQRIFDILRPIAASYSVVPLQTHRSTDLSELMRAVDFRGVATKRWGSMPAAYRSLSKTGTPEDVIAVIGSHFLVGEFLEKFPISSK
jgi:dihydrofolate synthase/folylpolyglutamate synthase